MKRLFRAFLICSVLALVGCFTASASAEMLVLMNEAAPAASDVESNSQDESSIDEEEERRKQEEQEKKDKENREEIINGVVSGIDEIGNQEIPQDNPSVSDSVNNSLDWAVSLLDGMGNMIKLFGTSDTPFGLDVKGFINDFSPYFKTLGYMIMLLLFGINMINSSIQFELTTYKGVLKLLIGLLAAKIWIDVSCDICIYIIDFVCDIGNQLYNYGFFNEVFVSIDELPTSNSDLWIIGALVDIILDFVTFIPVITMSLVVGIMAICVSVKLLMRLFEISIMTIISPVFFGCLLGDSTKGYFKSFFSEFLSSVSSVIWMALIYMAGVAWVAQLNQISPIGTLDNVLTWMLAMTLKFVVVIAMCILMLKPPAAFKRLTGG